MGTLSNIMGRRMKDFQPPKETWGEVVFMAAVCEADKANLHCALNAFGMYVLVVICFERIFSTSMLAKSIQM